MSIVYWPKPIKPKRRQVLRWDRIKQYCDSDILSFPLDDDDDDVNNNHDDNNMVVDSQQRRRRFTFALDSVESPEFLEMMSVLPSLHALQVRYYSSLDEPDFFLPHLAPALSNLTLLKLIDFHFLNIGDDGMRIISTGLRDNTSVTTLSLCNSDCGDQGIQ
jgi:hypothetical protein